MPPPKVTLTARGLVLLLDPTGSHATSTTDFFEKPLVPPQWKHGYSCVRRAASFRPKFLPSSTPQGVVTRNLGLLITDRYLLCQYSSRRDQPNNSMTHPTLPTFDTLDWTQPRFKNAGSKLSLRRTRPPRGDAVSFEPCFQMRGGQEAVLLRSRRSED